MQLAFGRLAFEVPVLYFTPPPVDSTKITFRTMRPTEEPSIEAQTPMSWRFQGREIADTEGAVKQLGAPVRIHNRVAYSRAQQTGLTAQEFETDGKAAEEIKQLYAYACIHLFPTEIEVAHVRTAKLSASRS